MYESKLPFIDKHYKHDCFQSCVCTVLSFGIAQFHTPMLNDQTHLLGKHIKCKFVYRDIHSTRTLYRHISTSGAIYHGAHLQSRIGGVRAHVSALVCQLAASVRFPRLQIRRWQQPNQFIHFLAASCRFELRARMPKCLHFCQKRHLVRVATQRDLHNVMHD